ncbi:PREDICTED: uncharacterized protein LOC105135871 isoform X2 [Populus euphratica]|uniref:Uncharacterized protein LOC105135871 isoform X2 n=1 Tax=Populus euphratica TaxID=75702 RepID=A0AAJ6Y1N6_POPEU|nr:PREDICTED: uncharacterized protein LOC105135871 isoform X2 [Populus euphratica]
MSTLRKRRPQDHQEPNKNTKPNEEINNNEHHETPKISVYEQTREERIKENLERMQKLGLMDLSLKLKACTAPSKRTPRTSPSSTKHPSPFLPRGPLRRSSRLQNSTPVSYSEVALTKKDGLLEDENTMQEVGSKPEIYTEEHEKLLGNTERSWTLFVDGCGKDGKRIYDPINGKTCHQCRQKTLGYRTHCCKCKMVQGQFCGDCLYMRYGEHVLEALENPNWLCPVCRGICNCSLCRQAKGWPPTGTLYRKISSLGYKSVAHYLIQTKRLQNTANEVSAKRSLPFSNMEVVSKESPQFIYKTAEQLEHQSEDKILDELKGKTENKMSSSRNLANDGQTKRALTFSGREVKSEIVESAKVNHEDHDNLGLSKPQCEEMNNEFEKEKHMQSNGNHATACQTDKSLTFSGSEARSKKVESAVTHEIHDDLALSMPKFEDVYENEFKSEEAKKETRIYHEIHDDLALSMPKFEGNIPSESCLKHKRKHASAINPCPDSIAARLRRRRWKSNGKDDAEFMGVDEKASNVKPAVNAMLSSQNMEEENEMHVEDDKRFVLESSQLKKRTHAEPNPDSIGARLRQRHRMGKGHENNELPGTRLRSRG